MELYKYLNPSRVDVIEKSLIKFSRPSDFNDPFEILPYIPELMSPATAESVFKEHIEIYLDEIKDDSVLKYIREEDLSLIPKKLLPIISNFTMDEARKMFDIREQFGEILSLFPQLIEGSIADLFKKKGDENIGILCLSEKHDNLIMWAHYAQNHEGFVIGFNSEDQFFNQKKSESDLLRSLKKVSYKEDRPEMIIFDNILNLRNNEEANDLMNKIFFTKSSHWASEEEWRIVFNLKDADTVVDDSAGKSYLFKYPPRIMTSIYLGVRIKDCTKKEIIQIIEERGNVIPIYQGFLNSKMYYLEFEKIN